MFSDTKDDLKLPDGEIGDQVKQAYEKDDETGLLIAVTSACTEEMVTGWKVGRTLDRVSLSIRFFLGHAKQISRIIILLRTIKCDGEFLVNKVI